MHTRPFAIKLRFARACIVYFLFLMALPAYAQYDEKDFTLYSVKNGLSHNWIRSMEQDEWGNMWIGTPLGLNRFDGNSFTQYHQGTNPIRLHSNNVRGLKDFGKHSLGIITTKGFKLLNTKDLSFQNFLIPDSTAFNTYRNAAWDAIRLPNQSIALTTASGFYVFDKTARLTFRYDAYSVKDIGKRKIFYGRNIFSLDASEYLIYITGFGMAYYNAEKNTFREVPKEEEEWRSFYPVTPQNDFSWITRYQISKNEFIFFNFTLNSITYYNRKLNKKVVTPLGTPTIEFASESKVVQLNDSIFAINGENAGFYLFHINRQSGNITFNPKKFLPAHKIYTLFFDRDRRLWVGTTKGLLQQKLNIPFLSSFLLQPAPTDSVTGGLTSSYRHKDKMYIGRMSRNKGLVIADTATLKIHKTIEFYGKNNMWNEIRSMQMYHPDTLWLGTNAGVLWFDTRSHRYGKVFELYNNNHLISKLDILAPIKQDGYAWMCGLLRGVVARYHIASRTFTFYTSSTTPALPFEKVKSIVYDSYGDVWIGGHSLARWNNKQQVFDTLITVYGGANKYDDDILTISADAKGSLWFHNVENGLLEYKIKEKSFHSYTKKDGLPSDVIETSSQVIKNILWLGSPNHLTSFNTETKKSIVYDFQDGFPDETPKARKIYYDMEAGKFYMFCNNYIVRFPLLHSKPASERNALLIHELRINNDTSFYFPENIPRLKHTENTLSIHFSMIDFERNNYEFSYKLNDDKNWISLNKQRNISLISLPPGKYHLQLRTYGKEGSQKLKDFIFFIDPPFWKTGWFIALLSLLFLSILYLAYRYRINQVRQKANIDKLLAQTGMKALHAQMNPHFISNSLNSIREMILNNENRQASHFLTKFAHLIRVTLDNSAQTFISLRSTMDYLQRYVEMEQIRNQAFTCSIIADEELDINEVVLPPMLIQPFVENAIWHGLSAEHKNIHVNINFTRQENQLVCIIDDNGIGINKSVENKTSSKNVRQSVGISNIKQRIQLLNEKYNLKSSVTFEDKSTLGTYNESGTLVTLKLPIEIKTS